MPRKSLRPPHIQGFGFDTIINGTINDNDIPERSTAHNSLPDAFMIGVSLCFQKIKETNDVII